MLTQSAIHLPDLSDCSLNPSTHSSGSFLVGLFLFELLIVEAFDDGESGSTFNSEAATAALLLASN